MKSSNKLLGAGLLTAIATSLCCVTPVLAIVAGTSVFASTFSWLEPARPYLIGITVLVIGLAWYQNLKLQKELDCNCETGVKPKFTQSKMFLGIVTILAGLLLAFPMYAHFFYPNKEKQITIADKRNIQRVEFSISGMTCASCDEHINQETNRIAGIIKSITSYETGSAVIEFDSSKTNVFEIEKAINSTGYLVTNKTVK